MNPNTLYAIDFDGVICHSAVETAKTAWKVAQNIWPDMQNQEITEKHILYFSLVRPCLEVGYEAILVMRLLQQGVSFSGGCLNYQRQLQSLIEDSGLNAENLQEIFGMTRDQEIEKDLAGWIESNPLFDGIAEKLKLLKQEDWVVITTKQERFVRLILEANDIQLENKRIFGLERKLSKQEVLINLKTRHPERPITFIEDRLPTLFGVQQNPELKDIKLQLVDWGYNKTKDRIEAERKDIEIIEIDDFLTE